MSPNSPTPDAASARQDRAGTTGPTSAPTSAPRSSPLLRSAGFLQGEKVFDTARGEDVTVVDAMRAIGQRDVSILVRRIDGSVVPRHVDELVRRPTPPAASGGAAR